MGYVQEKLGRRDRALAAYEEAYQLDATYLPALEGYGNLLVQSGRHDQALKVFQTILIHHREDLTDLEIVEIYWQIGEVHIALKQHDRAQNHFEKALAIDPGHEPSLRALIQLADAAGRWDRSAEYRQALVGVLDGEPKAEAALELGALARDRLKDPHTAIDAYAQALRLRPQSLEVMDALYVLYRETRQPGKAAEILETMLGQPRAAGRRSARQAGVVRARREPPRRAARHRAGGGGLQRRPGSRSAVHRGLQRDRGDARRGEGVEAAGGELRPDDPAASEDRRDARPRGWRCGGRSAISICRS